MDAGSLNLTYIVVVIISILVSLVIHEFMHAYVGHLLGDVTAEREGRLTLNPLSHIDPLMTVALPIATLLLFHAPVLAARPVPFNPYLVRYRTLGPALIAAAGPLSNLVLAFFGALAASSITGGSFWKQALAVFTELNVALFVFNLIPLPPLDGSRVVYALAPESVQRVMRDIEPYGLFIIFALVLLGGFASVLTGLNNAVLNLLPG